MKQLIMERILDELLDTDKSLLSPMMKLYYFAKETQNGILTNYLNKEINGYNVDDNIPDYRKTAGQLFISLQIGSYTDNIYEREVPRSSFNQEMQRLLTEIQLYEGVAVLERMANNNEGEPFIYKGLPMEALKIISPAVKKLYRSTGVVTPIRAKVRANANIVPQAVHTIRTRLMDFAYEIKDTFGIDISIFEYKKDQHNNNKIINNFMTTTIHNAGDGNVINTGDNSQINANISISKGDLTALQKRLEEIGVEPEDIKEISEIVQMEQPNGADLGPNACSWIGKMFTKSLSGVGKISIGAAGNLLATVIKLYFGIHG